MYKIPTTIDSPDNAYKNLTTGHSTIFSCTYNANSVPNLTITRWSVNGVVISHNTSQFTLITEYGIYELDEVKSTLIISNVNYGNDGTYILVGVNITAH